MRVSRIQLKATRRFSQLTIEEIPASAKLVFLCGPNGSGKSSLFDGMRSFFVKNTAFGGPNQEYLKKILDQEAVSSLFQPGLTSRATGQVSFAPLMYESSCLIDFHNGAVPSGNSISAGHVSPNVSQSRIPSHNSFYFRSAHRNEAEFTTSSIGGGVSHSQPSLAGSRAIDNDAAVSRNYQRLVQTSVDDLWTKGEKSTTFGDYRESNIGKVSEYLQSLFPDLKFVGIGRPLNGGTFKFQKGRTKDFPYRDLSSGEKAAFDLLLDVFSQQSALSDAIMCIDDARSTS